MLLLETAGAAAPIEPTALGVIALLVVGLGKALDWAFTRLDKVAEERKATRDGEAKPSPDAAAIASALAQWQDHEQRLRQLETQAAEDRGRRSALTTGSHQRAEVDR